MKKYVFVKQIFTNWLHVGLLLLSFDENQIMDLIHIDTPIKIKWSQCNSQ